MEAHKWVTQQDNYAKQRRRVHLRDSQKEQSESLGGAVSSKSGSKPQWDAVVGKEQLTLTKFPMICNVLCEASGSKSLHIDSRDWSPVSRSI